jgi:hypothetical protein
MKTEIKLTLNVDPDDGFDKSQNAPYFQEYLTVCGHGVQVCAKGLQRYVRLPKYVREITLVFFKRRVVESFEIGRRAMQVRHYVGNSLMFREIQQYCLIDHPRVPLLQSFRSELYRYYINGYKFFRIEY